MIQGIFEALNTGDLDALDAFYAENCVYHGIPPYADTAGLEAQQKNLQGFFAGYPDAKFTVEEVIIAGDSTVTRWYYEATHSGFTPARRIPPTGKKVIVKACTVAHIENGKVVHEWTYADQSALLEQLGVLSIAK